MNTPRFAKLATDLLAEDEATRAPSSEAEMRAVVAIEQALARRRRSRLLIRAAGTFAIAATIAVVVAGWRSSRATPAPAALAPQPSAAPAPLAAKAVESTEGAVVARDGRTASLSSAMSLTSGDRIEASPSGGTGIALADGSLVRIEPSSEVLVKGLEDTRRFLLTRGSLRADVAKLGPGQRFIVETEDAEVEVHGTSFRVSTREGSSACPARTRVDVTEGVVSVRSGGVEERIGAGASWPACDVVAAVAPEPLGPRVAALSPRADAGAPHIASMLPSAHPAPASPAPPPPSASPSASRALAEQNQLFGKATAARRAGDGPGAVAAYDRLLADHPNGFLAESAAVERMRVLDGMSHARGREAAAAYLARYPGGFARAEAERIAQ